MSRSCLARVVIVVGLLVDGVAAQACVGQAYSDAGYARCAGENGGACPHPIIHSPLLLFVYRVVLSTVYILGDIFGRLQGCVARRPNTHLWRLCKRRVWCIFLIIVTEQKLAVR